MDDVPVGGGRVEPCDLFRERLTGAGHAAAVEQARVEQLAHDHRQAALGVDVDHRVPAEGPRVHQHGQRARHAVELLLGDHLAPVVDARGAGQLGRVQHDVGGAAHRDGHQGGVAQRRRGDDVPRPDAAPGEHLQRVEQLGGELLDAAAILRCRAHHVQRLHAAGRDERLHGVVGEHAAAAAVTGRGLKRHPPPLLRRLRRRLEAGDDVDRLAGPGVDAGADRAVGHDHRGDVALQDRGEGPDRGLVAGDHGDHAAQVAAFEVEAHAVVGGLPADQRVAHLRRAVALPVGDPAREVGRDYPHREIGIDDTAAQLGLDRLDLRGDAGVADAVAEVADDSPGRAVDLVRVLSL